MDYKALRGKEIKREYEGPMTEPQKKPLVSIKLDLLNQNIMKLLIKIGTLENRLDSVLSLETPSSTNSRDVSMSSTKEALRTISSAIQEQSNLIEQAEIKLARILDRLEI